MNFNRGLIVQIICAVLLAASLPPQARAEQTNKSEFQAQFLKLCDLAVPKVRHESPKGRYFVDSYAVRALCAAYDMTGQKDYLDACRAWSERMVKDQERMIPRGAYYMHYNRKPGETNGDWYSADAAAIGMAVLATANRCERAERSRLLNSAKSFADLVIQNYVRPSGGVTDGIWSQSDREWWCSSGLFGSFSFLLYAETGDEQYLKTALRATRWLNDWDLTKDQPFPLSQQGPAMLMYVTECYSAGWPYISKDSSTKKGALEKVHWCLDWIQEQQQKPMRERLWQPTAGWGLKFGGLPFHQYVFSRYLPEGERLTASGDAGMQRLAGIVFASPQIKMDQLPMFMLLSYAERLNPGAIYRTGKQ